MHSNIKIPFVRDREQGMSSNLNQVVNSVLQNSTLISNFRRVLNVVCFLLGVSPASEVSFTHPPVGLNVSLGPFTACFCTQTPPPRPNGSGQTFSRIIPQHVLSLVHSTRTYLPMKMEETECSETPEYKFQTPGNHPKESIQHSTYLSLES